MEVNPTHGHIMASETTPKPVRKEPHNKKNRKVEPVSESQDSKLDTRA